MKFTLRQLQVFLAVARFNNISRAAASLSMSQSAASGALQALENQFSIQLFDRQGKRLRLNALGHRVRPRAESLLAQAHTLEQLLGQQVAGNLRLGATLTIGNYLAVTLMARYMQTYPGKQVSLAIDNTRAIVDKINRFELDVGLIEGEVNHPDLLFIPWLRDELLVCCAPQHPLAQKTALSDQDLQGAQWIIREPGSGTRQAFERAMHGLLPALQIALELQHTEAIKQAVMAGLGIACLSPIALADEIELGKLVVLNVPGRNFQRQFYQIWHRQKFIDSGIRQWLNLCAESG